MTTLERLKAMLAKDFDLQPEALSAPGVSLEALEIDSLRMIEILFSIEEAFKITVSADQAELKERIRTLEDLATYVDELVSAQQAKGEAA